MRVLMVTSFPIPGEYDGTAMLPIKILRALKPRGVDVVVAYLRLRPAAGLASTREDFEGTPGLTRFPPPGWVGGPGLKRIAREFPFDVVHAQHYGGATRAYSACRRYGWPMVYEIHSLLGDEVERDRLGRGLVFRSYLALERKVFRHAAQIIALGEPVKQVVVAEKGVPADRVSVIYPGIDLAEYDRPGPPAAIPASVPSTRSSCTSAASSTPTRACPILIEALPGIFESRPDARCVLVGGPAEAGERYRAELGPHGDRLIVLTGQTPEQVVALTRRADVLVHPRLACRENFSVQSKLAVYLAAGRPIVATDFGDYQQLLGAVRRRSPHPRCRRAARRRPSSESLNDPALAASLAAACSPGRPRILRHGSEHRPLPRRLPASHRLGPR